jgi:hypothetical protein
LMAQAMAEKKALTYGDSRWIKRSIRSHFPGPG